MKTTVSHILYYSCYICRIALYMQTVPEPISSGQVVIISHCLLCTMRYANGPFMYVYTLDIYTMRAIRVCTWYGQPSYWGFDAETDKQNGSQKPMHAAHYALTLIEWPGILLYMAQLTKTQAYLTTSFALPCSFVLLHIIPRSR